jgi:DnaJ-class molecular chaperone
MKENEENRDDCTRCNGTGFINDLTRPSSHSSTGYFKKECPKCGGTGGIL